MDISQYIDCCLVEKNLTRKDVAEQTFQSPQTIYNKFREKKFTVSELEEIANVLGAKLRLQFIDKETGKPLV